LLGLLEAKRALLVLRLCSIAARRASACWACLLCGPCAFPRRPPNAAKCVGIDRLPAAVDIVATCFPPGVARVVRYAVSNTGVPAIESCRSIARCCHQALPCRCPVRPSERPLRAKRVGKHWPSTPRRGTIRCMAVVGDRVLVSSRKVGESPRDGVVTGVTGSLLRVRWSTGEESTFVPSLGSLAVVGNKSGSGGRKPKATSAPAAKGPVRR
jgi:hypothetical protein